MSLKPQVGTQWWVAEITEWMSLKVYDEKINFILLDELMNIKCWAKWLDDFFIVLLILVLIVYLINELCIVISNYVYFVPFTYFAHYGAGNYVF